MKQSNIVLGIGIIVAVILIAGSILLKADPNEQQNSAVLDHNQTKISLTVKSITIGSLQKISKRIMDIL